MMIRFSRCDGGPVTWIGVTFGAGSGNGGAGPWARAVAGNTASRPSSNAAVAQLLIPFDIEPSLADLVGRCPPNPHREFTLTG